MLIDINAWTGRWNTHPVKGDITTVRESLTACRIEWICLSPLDAAWCPNQHRYNHIVYEAASKFSNIIPVPILDPTLPTWREELEQMLTQSRLGLVKLLPGYAPYNLTEADTLCGVLAEQKIGVIVQTRIDDPRHQHPLARTEDVPAEHIADLAERHPDLTVIAGGPTTVAIRSLRGQLLTLPNLYADVSQADGMDALLTMVREGLTHKLLFGSHAPLFVPHAAMARVVNDLAEEDAEAILGGNADRMFCFNNL